MPLFRAEQDKNFRPQLLAKPLLTGAASRFSSRVKILE
jgi:hypothetical protein